MKSDPSLVLNGFLKIFTFTVQLYKMSTTHTSPVLPSRNSSNIVYYCYELLLRLISQRAGQYHQVREIFIKWLCLLPVGRTLANPWLYDCHEL